MRRSLWIGFSALLLCTSCVTRGPLASADVLHRAALASQSLQAATYTIEAGFSSLEGQKQANLTATVNGRLQNAGNQTQFEATVKGKFDDGQNAQDVDAKVAVIVASPTEVFVKLDSLTFTPETGTYKSDTWKPLMGKWWKIPSLEKAAEGQSITPDPALLRAQSEVVQITSDEGIQRIRGRDAYRYSVTLDKQKLLEYLRKTALEKKEQFSEGEVAKFLSTFDAIGELWVDADNFYIHRLGWSVTPPVNADRTKKSFSLNFSVDLSDFGHADPISPPGDATVFTPEALMPHPDLPMSSASSSPKVP